MNHMDKLQKVEAYFLYTEGKEYTLSGVTWVHRFIPKHDLNTRVSSNDLYTAIDMAYTQIKKQAI